MSIRFPRPAPQVLDETREITIVRRDAGELLGVSESGADISGVAAESDQRETIYFYTDNDTNSRQLVGESSYAVTFPKGQLPPVKGFWSLTVYNPEHVFAPNAPNRFALGTKNKSLKYNSNGSLTIYVGTKSPGPDKQANWIPAPAGNFSVWLRTYWPDQAILDGKWQPPAIKTVE